MFHETHKNGVGEENGYSEEYGPSEIGQIGNMASKYGASQKSEASMRLRIR